MSDNNATARFNSMGNDFTVTFSINMLDGRAKANLLRALLDDAGYHEELKALEGASADVATALLTKIYDKLWNKG